MSRTRARLSVGQYLGDPARGYRVESVILYREWDPEDRRYDHWEEWELTGYGLQDTWIEVDHYLDEIVVYEPVLIDEPIDARTLAVGRTLTVRSGGAELMGVVTEVGAGEVEQASAYSRAAAPVGEPLAYATIHLTPRPGAPASAAPPAPGYSAAPRPIVLADSEGMDVTVETSGWQPVRAYRRRPVGEAEQVRLLGAVVYRPRHRLRPGGAAGPGGAPAAPAAAVAGGGGGGGRARAAGSGPAGRGVGATIVALLVLLVLVFVFATACQSSDDCDSDTQTCGTGTQHRSVYGGGGAGGGK